MLQAELSGRFSERWCQDDIEEQKDEIDELNLDCVREKLCRPVEKGGEGWTLHKAKIVEVWYKRFLRLCKMQSTAVVPLGDIDEFWHTHILFTRKYANDCQKSLGRFLHHSPFVGDAAEEARTRPLHERSKALFIEHFGESPIEAIQACGCDSSCSSGCCGNDS